MRTLNDYFITGVIPNVSSASETFVAIPDGGRIIKIITHNKAATTGTAAISFEIGGVAVTDGGISHTASGSASRVATAEPTALNSVEEDGTILMREFIDEYIPILKARQEN